MNPSQPDFWTARLVPAEQPVLTPQAMDVEAAIRNALDNRTDLAQARKQLEQTDIGIRFAKNQRLPAVNAIVNYGLAGVGGTRTIYDDSAEASRCRSARRSAVSATRLRDVFGNDFRTWSVQLNVNYPIGTSQAEAGLAQGRVQRAAGRHEPARRSSCRSRPRCATRRGRWTRP